MKVFRVEAEYTNITFPLIQDLLQKALKRGLGEITLDQVKHYCRTGQQQLWIGLDEETKVKIYNKAYVSVYDAITKYDNPNATKKRCHKLLATI